MLISAVIICLIPSTLAIFYHKPPPHNRIHVCLTPPNTMFKVQKHITECQNEVKSHLFHEAFSLIHDTAFHHPADHTHFGYKDEHDEFGNHKFSLTEQEILRFFESHEHPGHRDKYLSSGLGTHDHLHDHPHDHPLDHLHKHAHEHPHEHHPIQNPHALEPIAHHPHAVSHGWQQQQSPYLDIHEKTDAVQVDNKAEDAQRSMGTVPGTRNPYTYFDIATGEAVKGQEHPRRSVHISDIHSDHHHDDIHPDHHHDDIHPTTATFKDKRIAGCLMHCLYEKDHAIDPHTGYPTLDGLVNFYSDGVHEHGFFMTTLRAADFCLKGASHKYHINRHIKPSTGISCDLAFDIFDCVSDRITEYCSKHHFHDEHHLKGHHPTHPEHVIDDHYEDTSYHDEDAYYY